MSENERDLGPEAIERMLAAASGEPGDAQLLERVRARTSGELAGTTRVARARRNWIPVIAIGAVPVAAAAALLAVALLNFHPVAQRQQPAVNPSPSASASASPAASPSPSIGSPAPLSQLKMFGSTAGWGSSAEGASTRVLFTRDAGLGWKTAPLSGQLTKAVYFLDADHAAAVLEGGSGDGKGLTLATTADGGNTWTRQGIPDLDGPPAALQFVDAQHGWLTTNLGGAAGSNGLSLFRTTDGGATWKWVSTGSPGYQGTGPGHMPSTCQKDAPVFANASDGFISGSCAGTEPVSYASHDGGVTWTYQRLFLAGQTSGAGPNCSGGSCSTHPAQFSSQRDGYMVLSGSVNILYVTHDAGMSWLGNSLPTSPDHRSVDQRRDDPHRDRRFHHGLPRRRRELAEGHGTARVQRRSHPGLRQRQRGVGRGPRNEHRQDHPVAHG